MSNNFEELSKFFVLDNSDSFVFHGNEVNFFFQTIPRLTLDETSYTLVHKIVYFFSPTMESEDLQKLILSKYEKGEDSSEICRYLNDALCFEQSNDGGK